MESELSVEPRLLPEALLFTPQLVYRACRAPNLEEKNKDLHELALCLVSNPDGFLDRLVEVALKLCDGDTVGISLTTSLETGHVTPARLPTAMESSASVSGWSRLTLVTEIVIGIAAIEQALVTLDRTFHWSVRSFHNAVFRGLSGWVHLLIIRAKASAMVS